MPRRVIGVRNARVVVRLSSFYLLFLRFKYVRRAKIEAFVHGNLNAADARAVLASLRASLTPQQAWTANVPVARHVRFADGASHVYRKLTLVGEENSAVAVYLQLGIGFKVDIPLFFFLNYSFPFFSSL